jgi:hypothetical protein
VLENFQFSISDQTIRRIIKKHGLKFLSKLKKPELSVKHVKEREKNYQTYKKIILFIEGKFIFSDESKFDLHGEDSNRRIWCQSGTQLNRENIQTTKKFGWGNIMVWDV